MILRRVMCNKNKIIYWLIVICWMGVIFFFSAQNAEQSNQSSGWVIDKLFSIQYLSSVEQVADSFFMQFSVRKIAHFSEYLVLGILLFKAFEQGKLLNKNFVYKAFLVSVFYALTDEFHQAYIPGRSAQWQDVLLDCFGAFVGILCILFFTRKSWKRY